MILCFALQSCLAIQFKIFIGNHTRQPFDDSTLYTNETDHRLYSDDESR